ncbi:phage major capsid protein, P2 family [Serratia ficaria]|uniref:phage major capsid protein, P2 family n=1 Tax=Serratia ficaria TaxID=61651 RepID=UPI0021772397|nr:phage major capsid protein, P2 family [Serratia ficaria]CAI1109011.1 phage major capsid protein, P2 family [Serratia ficaria]CAI1812104.1 phage major capsid protein, P2 family [Serratia ficaria]CAI2489423.1 phage major capsid protein, P2 family [Serratia ficaria]CAI2791679.1 phage major capsid protein, P2 family [Serratia ficaria]
MKKQTRFKFNAYLTQVAKLNGIEVDDIGHKFSVEPSVTQTLMDTVQESSEFLTKINMVPVDELKGEKVGVGVNGSIASTTDTDSGKERQTADFTALESKGYECQQMNFDFHLRYKTLDLWARYQDFQLRIRNAIVKRQALDFIMAGFNGISRAPTSDRSKNPMLQDVAIGWLQKYRNEAPTRVMSKITGDDGAVISEVIRIGKGGDYANLDAVVMDATNNLIAPWHQESPDLVVICGRKLLADKYFPLVNQDQPNTEAMAADVIVSQKRIGNLPAVRVPYFPANAMFVTSLENLSIYFMDESHRRHIEENAKRDRVENYESMNIDYVVEDYGFGCLIENIEMGDFSKPATASQPQEAAATDSAEQPQETAATDSGE